MTFVSSWKEPTGKKAYISAGKELPTQDDSKEVAYWMLAKRMEEAFAGELATVGEIYYTVGRPLGMSLDQIKELVKGAKAGGYLKGA